MEKMSELANAPLSRPLDRDALANDEATLRNLVGMLNDPRITGAQVPLEEKSETFPHNAGETIRESGQAYKGPTPAPSQAAPISYSNLLLTGRGAARIENLAAQIDGAVVLSPESVVKSFLDTWADGVPVSDTVLAQLRAWGEGLVDKQHPMTLERVWITHVCRQIDNSFATPDFWAKRLSYEIDAQRMTKPKLQVVVLGVTSLNDFNFFRKEGFTHFHVLVSNQTASKNLGTIQPNIPDPISTALDNDVIKKISVQKNGERLRCVWNDPEVPPPSGRFYSVQDFLQAVSQNEPVEIPKVEL